MSDQQRPPLQHRLSLAGFAAAPGGGAFRCHASRGHFCIRMAVGAVAMLGLSVLRAGARRTAGLGHTALRELQRGVIPSV
jgi:hypothetical protein